MFYSDIDIRLYRLRRNEYYKSVLRNNLFMEILNNNGPEPCGPPLFTDREMTHSLQL